MYTYIYTCLCIKRDCIHYCLMRGFTDKDKGRDGRRDPKDKGGSKVVVNHNRVD